MLLMKENKKNYNSWSKRLYYMICFLKYGLFLNIFNGKISFMFYSTKCKCKKLQIMRHGKTVGVENKEFMSDTSPNSQLSQKGIIEIEKISKSIEKDCPDIVMVSTLTRTMQTYLELQKNISSKLTVEFLENMRGINNSVWEGKTFDMLDENNLIVFLRRECEHNVFSKTENGDSWADVIFRCSKILKTINKMYQDKKVLLISQGSIYQGLKILLHIEKSPWYNYSANKMFNLSETIDGESVNYGCVYSLI